MEPIRQINPPEWMGAPETLAVMQALEEDGAQQDAGADRFNALFVGGCVRNTLLGQAVTDIDIATRLEPAQVQKRMEEAQIKCVPTGLEHGTVTAVVNGKTFEITTLRRDVETDGRHAVIAFTQSWAEDAQRRDFTMNTLLAAPDGAVYDPVGRGIADLEAGRVVFVGDAAARIAEDYLRILRFFRFHARYGTGALDEAGLAACRAAAAKIATLSRERVAHEVLGILGVESPGECLALMFENGVLAGLAHAAYDGAALGRLCEAQKKHVGQTGNVGDTPGERRASRDAEAVFLAVRLFVLGGFDPAHLPVFEKYLVLSNAQKQAYLKLGEIWVKINCDTISEKQIKELIYKYKNSAVLQGLCLRCAHPELSLPEPDSSELTRLVDIAQSWVPPVFPLTGEDLIAAGLSEGPALGQKLKEIEFWWIGQDFTPTKQQCLECL